MKKVRKKTNIALIVLLSLCLLIIVIVSYFFDTAGQSSFDISRSAHIKIIEVMTNNSSALINRDGIVADYAIIHNNSDTDINLDGWGLSDRPYEIRYSFSDCILEAGASKFVFFPGKGNSNSGVGELYTTFGLSSSGEQLLLFSPDGEIAQTVDVPALGKDEVYSLSSGTWQIASIDTYEQDTAYAGSFYKDIYITEIITSNVSYMVEGKTADLIEIYNGSDAVVDLSDYALSDKLDQPEQYCFEKGCLIQPGAYALVLCTSGESTSPQIHYNSAFSLSSSGETLYLYCRSSGQIMDVIHVPELEADTSYARIGDIWTIEFSPTPGFANTPSGLSALDAQLRNANLSQVLISEICTSNFSVDLPYVEGHYDYIELYNAGNEPVNLSGYYLSDNPKKPRKWCLPDMVLFPGDFRLIYCEPNNQGMDTENVIYSNFRLSVSGCGVYLSDPEGTLLDRVRVPALFSNTSYGRTPGLSGLYIYDTPTPASPNGQGFVGYSSTPCASMQGGLYERPVMVELTAQEGAAIYYTLDGSTPTTLSLPYSEPILIEKTAVLRACAIEDGRAMSPALTQTYLISTYHTLPVISLTTDPDHLWNEENGMLADGPLLDRETQSRPWLKATYAQKTKYPGYIEYYDPSGTQQFSQGMIFHCMGQFSLDMPQKSFSIEANSQFGFSAFNYAAFADRPYTSYAVFALRNGGQDGLYTRVLDGLQARLVDQSGSSVITQAWSPVIVYLNGQYWGHYNLRERVGIEMIAQHEGWADPNNIDLLEGDGTRSSNVNHGSNEAYRALIQYIEDHSLAQEPEALEHVLNQVDIDNMFDYFFFEMFFGNEDSGNIRFYRNAVEGDGKWRYVFYDLDWGLFDSSYGGPAHVLDPEGMGTYHITSNAILIALLEVPDMRDRFLRRGGELFQTVLTTENMIALLEEMVAQIQPEMQMHFTRWAEEMYPQISLDQPKNPEGAYAYWQERVARAKNVMKKRPTLFWQMMQEQFGLSDDIMVQYFGECPEMPADAK